LVLEQKAELEKLTKRGGEDQQAMALLETHLKNSEGMGSALLKISQRNHPFMMNLLSALQKNLPVSLPLMTSLRSSRYSNPSTPPSSNPLRSVTKGTKTKNELEEKNAQAMAEMAEKLKASQQRVKTLVAKARTYEAESKEIDETIFRKNFFVFRHIILCLCIRDANPDRGTFACTAALGYEFNDQSKCSRTEAYEEAKNSVEDLIEAWHAIARKLSLKGYRTTIIDKMTKLMHIGAGNNGGLARVFSTRSYCHCPCHVQSSLPRHGFRDDCMRSPQGHQCKKCSHGN
jgi:hypothetical protein